MTEEIKNVINEISSTGENPNRFSKKNFNKLVKAILNDSGKNAVEEPDVVTSIILKAFYSVFNGTEYEDKAEKYANRTIKEINACTTGKWKVQTAIDYMDYHLRTSPVNYSWDPVNKKPITLNNPKNEYYKLRRKALEIAHKDLNKEKDRVSKNVHL